MAPEPVRIAITAVTLTGNHGAEAMLLATVGRLRERVPGARFEVFGAAASADRARVRDPAVRFRSLSSSALLFRLIPGAALLALLRRLGLERVAALLPPDVRALAACRVLVDLAGVSFVSGRGRFLAYNTLTLVPAFLLGIPVVKGSQAMGPFDPLNRGLARRVLGRCDAVFARGERSLAHVRGLLGERSTVLRAADVAFLLEPGDALGQPASPGIARVLRELERRREGARSVVGLCPSSLLAAQDPSGYPALFAALAEELTAAGDLVILFPYATRGSSAAGPRNNDLHAIARVLEILPSDTRPRVLTVEGDVHAVELLGLLRALDLAVVSRFHAMVGALSVGIPPVVVGWSHKYREVMEEFGLGEHALEAGEATATRVMARLDALRADLPAERERVAARLGDVRRSAMEPVDHAAGVALRPGRSTSRSVPQNERDSSASSAWSTPT